MSLVDSQLKCLPDVINQLNALYPIAVFPCRIAPILSEHVSDILLKQILIGNGDLAWIGAFRDSRIDRGRRRICSRHSSARMRRHHETVQARSSYSEGVRELGGAPVRQNVRVMHNGREKWLESTFEWLD